MSGFDVTVDLNSNIEDKLLELLKDDATMLEIHTTMARFCDDYVPFLEGPLSQTMDILPEHIVYKVPYAHYQYFLHDMDADLAGETNRTRLYHPKATSFWDKAMVMEKGDAFWNEVLRILKRRWEEKYGSR